jgi:hypothetical protein
VSKTQGHAILKERINGDSCAHNHGRFTITRHKTAITTASPLKDEPHLRLFGWSIHSPESPAACQTSVAY